MGLEQTAAPGSGKDIGSRCKWIPSDAGVLAAGVTGRTFAAVGIYKRRILREKVRKHAFDREKNLRKNDLDQEKNKVTKISTKKKSFRFLLIFLNKFPPLCSNLKLFITCYPGSNMLNCVVTNVPPTYMFSFLLCHNQYSYNLFVVIS